MFVTSIIMLEKLIEITKSIGIYLSRLNGDYKYYNKEYFDLYMSEVNNDIKCLKFLLDLPEFERENNQLFYLIEKYNSNYCPSTFYKYLSNESKLEYLYKRVEISELLHKIINF